MDLLSKLAFIFLLSLGFVGCGVKGSPLPPLNPAPLGRGEFRFKEAEMKKSSKKQKLKNQIDNDNPSAETEEQ